jgi:hypothetical protein
MDALKERRADNHFNADGVGQEKRAKEVNASVYNQVVDGEKISPLLERRVGLSAVVQAKKHPSRLLA